MRAKPSKSVTAESVCKRLASLCARSEQCEEGIRQKLMKTGLPLTDREEILDFLKRERFVDNARYARALVRDARNLKLWSRRKTMLQLAANRIPRDIAREAIEEEYTPEEERATVARLIQRAYRSRRGEADSKWRQSLIAVMARRGFPVGVSIEEIKKLLAEESAGDNGL